MMSMEQCNHRQRGRALDAPIPALSMAFFVCALVCNTLCAATQPELSPAAVANRDAVSKTKGLVAFWDFTHGDEHAWHSFFDSTVETRSYPAYLRRIGDDGLYSSATWPYQTPESQLVFDATGPFGNAVRFNRGHIYGAVERADFDRSLLDLTRKRPFTMIAWVRFVGPRHMVAGIWDEGGWDKYGGRRQFAIFAGLFGRRGVIAHISATGAASFPQSTIEGSQYARSRAIDGAPFEDHEWVALAATYEPESREVRAYLNGVCTPLAVTDPVAQDVYRFSEPQPANPFLFPLPIYHPRAFVLKFNGYSLEKDGVSEHRLQLDLDSGRIAFESEPRERPTNTTYRIQIDVLRAGTSILDTPLEFRTDQTSSGQLPAALEVKQGDYIQATLELQNKTGWQPVGSRVQREILPGAPFTFGRALGLGAEELEHGSELFIDGVAIFNRVLTEDELKRLALVP